MPRPFTVTLEELVKQYQKKENYLCFVVAYIANAREPKFDEHGDRILEFPNSRELIQKFRELMPQFFVDEKDIDRGGNTVFEGHLKPESECPDFRGVRPDFRGVLLQECIKVYGGDFQITLEIHPHHDRHGLSVSREIALFTTW